MGPDNQVYEFGIMNSVLKSAGASGSHDLLEHGNSDLSLLKI